MRLDNAAMRREMVDELRRLGIRDERTLDALARVPRHRFVDARLAPRAYENCPLPIDAGQTISQPFIVAYAIAALELQPEERVLEIGTGSGYQAAVLGELVREVHSVERIENLHDASRRLLDELGYGTVHCHSGDGTLGWKQAAPYDAILVAASGPRLPEPLVEQLAPGGRLIAPVGDHREQMLVRVHVDPVSGRRHRDELVPVRFVPLLGRHAWSPPKDEDTDRA